MRSRTEALAEYDRIVKQEEEILKEMRILRSEDRPQEATLKEAERLVQEYAPISRRLHLVLEELSLYRTHSN